MSSGGAALLALDAEFLFHLHLTTGDAMMVNDGPEGTRIIAPVTGGTFEGPRLSGAVAAATGGDWVRVGPHGEMRLDVRLVLHTHDGALLHVSYRGVLVRGESGAQVRSAPLFEVGDERYRWLNSIQAVGIGTTGRGTVDYDIYALK